MEFRVLGPVEVRQDGEARSTGGGRERYVLAMLLLGAGRQSSAARLIDALWDVPPPSAKAQLHNMISRLRRSTDAQIVTGAGGYELRLTEHDTLDLAEFRRLVAEGLRVGDSAVASALLCEALSLWRGPALADIPDELAAAARHGLHEERLAAAEARLDAQLALGQHLDVLRDLDQLLAEHPYRENLYQAMMLAQLGAGLRAEALETYRLAYRTLADGLGIEPGPALRELEGRILRGEDVPAAPAVRVVVRQLPPLTPVLTGREKLIGEIKAGLDRCDGQSPMLAVLVGPGGVGKTTVALAAAASFAGGQLYADLRGSREDPADPHTVAGRFLHALGVRQSKLPADPDERVVMYRSLLARTRTLVLLDDALSEEQVRPLLPGDPGCAALITSRRQLGALVGAVRWPVPVLSAAESRDLLARIAGEERTAAEPAAAAELAEVCGRLPLAVSIVAARLAVRQDWTLAEFRHRLGRERDRLDELAVGDLDVRASIASSYHTLTTQARRLLRLLGLVSAPDWPAWVPGALLGAPGSRFLDELVDVHLVEPLGRDGAGQDRFRLHDLVADYAREEVASIEEVTTRTAALTRLLEMWLALAADADRQVPHGRSFAPPAVLVFSPVRPVELPYDWFDAERQSLVVAVAEAARLGLTDLAARLALHMSGYLELRCYYDDWFTVLRQAVEPVRMAGPDSLLVRLLTALFAAHTLADQYAEQLAVAEEELTVARRLRDRAAEVTALGHVGRAFADNGQFAVATKLLAEELALASDPSSVLAATLHNAVHFIVLGDASRALELLERTPPDSARAGYHGYYTGLALIDLGRFAEAARALEAVLSYCSSVGDDLGVAYVLVALASVDVRCRRWREATGRVEKALRAAEKLGAPDAVAEALRTLGDLAAARGRNTAAIGALYRALEIWRPLGAPINVASTLARLEYVLRAVGDSAATACHREWRGVLVEFGLDDRCLRLPSLFG